MKRFKFSWVALIVLVLTVGLCAVACKRLAEADTYTLTFVTNGGTEIAPITAKEGDEITPPSNPEKEGHDFIGWYLTENFDGEAQTIPTVMPAENRTYYAKFDARVYTLTLDVNGGTLATTSYSVEYGTKLSEFLKEIRPVRGELRFAGWYLGDSAITSSDTVKGDVTLVAQWEAPYTVEVYLQQLNAEKTAASDTYLLSAEHAASGWAILGKEFDASINMANYTVSPDHEGSIVTKVIEESGNNFKIYYKLKIRTISYNANTEGAYTGEMATEEYAHGVIVQIKDCAYIRNGYHFGAWSTRADEFRTAPTTSFAITQDYTFYAFWDRAYTNEADSDDIVYVSSVVWAGLGQVYRLEEGGKKEGFLNINDYISWVLEFTFVEDEGEQYGRIDTDTGTFRYRGEEEGVYLGFDYATEKYMTHVLYLDGYGESVWGVVDAAGGVNFGNNFGTYSYNDVYDDYRFTYVDIETQEETDAYFYFRVLSQFPDGATGTSGYAGIFMVQGYESGSYLLFDVFYGEIDYNLVLELDGYGNAREISFDPYTDTMAILSEGTYRATELYEDYMGEWEYVTTSSTSDLSRFILNMVAYDDENIPVYLMYDESLAGTLAAASGSDARLILGGYNSALYYPNGLAGRAITGSFLISDDVNLSFIPYEDGAAAGLMLFVIDWTPNGEFLGTFTLNTDGFIVDGEGTLTGYKGTSAYVEIPTRVTAIAADALNYTHTEVSLRSVIIPASVLSIGARAFENNYTLSQAVFLSTTPIEIDWTGTVDPFRWPRGDFAIIVPDGYEDVYREAWSDCPHKITSFAELNNRPEWEIEDGVLIAYNNKDENPQDLDLRIPDAVKEIAARVFFALDYIRSVDLNNVEIVGEDAFSNCTSLVSVTALRLKTVGEGAFSLCTSLTQISLPAVQTLGDEAFASCDVLTQVTLGEEISVIGSAAFAYCATETEDMTIFVVLEGSNVPVIGGNAFYGCAARRISVDTIQTALQFYSAPDWHSYILSLWVREAAQSELAGEWVNLQTLEPVSFSGRAELFLFEVWLYEVNGFVVTFYFADDSARGYDIISGSYQNGAVNFSYGSLSYRLVRTDAPVTYTCGEETLVLNLPEADYSAYPFLIPATFNGVSVTVSATYSTITADGFEVDGRRHLITFTLTNSRTFTYTSRPNDTSGPYTAEDGSEVTFRYSGSLIYATGILTVDGFEMKGTAGWYTTQEDETTFNISIPWRSTNYLVTVVITGEDTFTYSWVVGSTRKVISSENGLGGIIAIYDKNGAVTALQLLLPTTAGGANVTVDSTYIQQADGSYLFYVEFDEEYYDEESGTFYLEPSPLNGTYHVVIDFDGETCTVLKID